MSESQRKNTSRLSFIYGSPRLVALITVLVLGSGIAGIAIVQKQRDSKAAVSQQTFSWNKGDWQTAMNRWTATGTPGFDQYAEVYKDGEAFAMSFKVGPNYPDGYDVCYSMPMVGIEGTQNVRFTEADFTYVTNEDSSTGVRVKVDGVDMPFTRVQDLPGGNRAVTANFTSVPGGGMQPGQTMSFCHYKRNGAGKITAPKRTVSVFAYSIRGSYEIFVPDAPTEPDRLNAGNNADAPAATPAPAPSTGGQAAPAPVTERAVGTPPAGSRVIDSNQWGRWGFPAIDPGATLPHGNNENLTITFNKGATYKNSVTPCWTTVIPNGYTATAFEPFVERNDAGKNTVFLRASNNPDEIFPSAGGKAIGNNKYWQFANPVGAGGTISVCSINNNGEKFESERNVKVTQYYIYGTGGTEGQQIDATPPTIDIISPANGATVSGNITIKARVSDNKGIRYIEFKNGGAPLDGKQLAPDTNFEQVIDTTKLPNGDFRIEPLAFDTDNNFSVNNDAKAITIKIQNANPNPPERLNAGNNADAPRNTPSGNTTTGSGSSGSSGSTPSQQTPPNTKPAAQPSPAECTTGASLAQAEDGKRSDNTAVANDPLQPDVKAAVLFANDSYVECTLTVPKDGFFGVGANLRSADFRGVAQAKLSMAGFGGAVTSRTITAPERQAYGLVRFEETAAARRNVTGQNEVGDYRYLTSGQKVVVRVTFVNDATDRKGGDRNLWVDYLTLVEVNPESATAAALASGDNKQTTVVVPSKPKVSRIEAEEASLHKGANVEQGSGKKFVRL